MDGLQKPCAGSVDKSPPKEIMWKTFPHRLFFGREFTQSWGPGGTAFLDPESNSQDKTHMCLYRITYVTTSESIMSCCFMFIQWYCVLKLVFSCRLEQFNDLLVQENVGRYAMNSPLFDLAALKSVTGEEPHSLEVCLEVCLNLLSLLASWFFATKAYTFY